MKDPEKISSGFLRRNLLAMGQAVHPEFQQGKRKRGKVPQKEKYRAVACEAFSPTFSKKVAQQHWKQMSTGCGSCSEGDENRTRDFHHVKVASYR